MKLPISVKMGSILLFIIILLISLSFISLFITTNQILKQKNISQIDFSYFYYFFILVFLVSLIITIAVTLILYQQIDDKLAKFDYTLNLINNNKLDQLTRTDKKDKINFLIDEVIDSAKNFDIKLKATAATTAKTAKIIKKVEEEVNEDAGKGFKLASNSDPVTNVSSRQYFNEYIQLEWRRALRSQTNLALIFCDIDEFSKYNDSYGRDKGNETLREVGQNIRYIIKRAGDFIARYSDDQFGIILPNTQKSGAMLIAEKMRSIIRDLGLEHTHSKITDRITLSFGVVSEVPTREDNPSSLIHKALLALDQAKKNGCNRVQGFIKK